MPILNLPWYPSIIAWHFMYASHRSKFLIEGAEGTSIFS